MKALVIAEHSDAARELAAGARTLADEVVLAPFCEVPEACADTILNIVVPAGAALDDAAESLTAAVAEADLVLVEPTRRLKIVAGKLAAQAGTAVLTDVMEFGDAGVKSLYFGGVAERVRKAVADTAFYTVVSGTFAGAVASGANTVKDVAWVAPEHALEVAGCAPVEKSAADPSKAEVVVAAGRGFAEEADLDLARALVEKVGGGLACSRPLTEGVTWLPSELYVGVSGLMLSPKVYVAAGISGQMQHMVGCNRSGTIFAINKDKTAPVFKQCDYGLVGDVKTVLPALIAAL